MDIDFAQITQLKENKELVSCKIIYLLKIDLHL